jgi:hypothetical protein
MGNWQTAIYRTRNTARNAGNWWKAGSVAVAGECGRRRFEALYFLATPFLFRSHERAKFILPTSPLTHSDSQPAVAEVGAVVFAFLEHLVQ